MKINKKTVKIKETKSQGAVPPAYLSEQTIVQHTGDRVLMAAGPLLLLRGLQQEKQAVEGKQEELTLLMEEQEGVCVLLHLWEDTGQTVNTQLTRYIPQTQDLGSQCRGRSYMNHHTHRRKTT